jgi:hypothetical protein
MEYSVFQIQWIPSAISVKNKHTIEEMRMGLLNPPAMSAVAPSSSPLSPR